MPQNVGDVYQANVHYAVAGVPCSSTIATAVGSPGTIDEIIFLETLAVQVGLRFYTAILPILSDKTTYVGCSVRKVGGGAGYQGWDFTNNGAVGGITGIDPLPPLAPAIIQLIGNGPTKIIRGRMFVSGVPETDVIAGIFKDTKLVDWLSAAATLVATPYTISATGGPVGLLQCIYSRKLSLGITVEQALMNNQIGTQRRRVERIPIPVPSAP